jgi:hypothetical protein
MRNWLPILAVTLALTGLPSIQGQPLKHGNEASRASELKTDSGKNPPAAAYAGKFQEDCNRLAFKNGPGCESARNNEYPLAIGELAAAYFAIQRNAERDGYDWLAYWAAILLTLAALIGVGLALSTLKWLKNQTLAAKATADFALLNAQAVINTERAWIVVTMKSSKEGVYTIVAENVGRTPAKLVSSFSDVSILRSPKKMPETPTYKTQRYDGMVPTLCFQKERRQIFEITVSEIIDSAYPYGNAPDNALEFMDIYFFGKILYQDILNTGKAPQSNPPHETKWCFKLLTLANAVPISHPYVSPHEYVGYT